MLLIIQNITNEIAKNEKFLLIGYKLMDFNKCNEMSPPAFSLSFRQEKF
jgi:hypothetical protein